MSSSYPPNILVHTWFFRSEGQSTPLTEAAGILSLTSRPFGDLAEYEREQRPAADRHGEDGREFLVGNQPHQLLVRSFLEEYPIRVRAALVHAQRLRLPSLSAVRLLSISRSPLLLWFFEDHIAPTHILDWMKGSSE